ncbi:MAG: hypothetical protein HC906_07650 [Bacteroidales bacterium]|nr:hypothetical protein [Bacteroidales bacterium]
MIPLYAQTNKNLKFSKSHHLVAGYNHLFNSNKRFKAEAYYQHLYNIPVNQYPSVLSLANYESDYYNYDYDSLVIKD